MIILLFLAYITGVLQYCAMHGSIRCVGSLHCPVRGICYIIRCPAHHSLHGLHVVVFANADWGLFGTPGASGGAPVDVMTKQSEEIVPLIAVIPSYGSHLG